MPEFDVLTSVNGRFEGAISPRDRGLAYGDGLFETMRLAHGRVPFQAAHRERLLHGCERLGLLLRPETLDAHLSSMLARARERGQSRGVLKIIVTRGSGGRGYQVPRHSRATVIVSLFPAPELPLNPEARRVWICQHRLPDNPPLAGLKHLNKLDHVLASREWRDRNCDEGLLFDSKGELVEACSRNVFLWRSGRLSTPPLDCSGVAGILRQRILEHYAPRLGVEVKVEPVDREGLLAGEALLLCNSVTGIWPVKYLEATDLHLELPAASLSTQLQAMFDDDLRRG